MVGHKKAARLTRKSRVNSLPLLCLLSAMALLFACQAPQVSSDVTDEKRLGQAIGNALSGARQAVGRGWQSAVAFARRGNPPSRPPSVPRAQPVPQTPPAVAGQPGPQIPPAVAQQARPPFNPVANPAGNQATRKVAVKGGSKAVVALGKACVKVPIACKVAIPGMAASLVFLAGDAAMQWRQAHVSAENAKDTYAAAGERLAFNQTCVRNGGRLENGECVTDIAVPAGENPRALLEQGRGGVPLGTQSISVGTDSGSVEAEAWVPDEIDLLGGAADLFERSAKLTEGRSSVDYLGAFCTESDQAPSAQACSDAGITPTARAAGKHAYVLVDEQPIEEGMKACLLIHATGLPDNSELIAKLCIRESMQDDVSACFGATTHELEGTNHFHAAFLGDPAMSVGYRLYYDDEMQEIIAVDEVEDPVAQLQLTNMVSGAGLPEPYSCMSLMTSADSIVNLAGCSYSRLLMREAGAEVSGERALISGHGQESAAYEGDVRALTCEWSPGTDSGTESTPDSSD